MPDPKTAKNRVHRDVASRSADDQAGLVARLEDLGARRLANELCILTPR